MKKSETLYEQMRTEMLTTVFDLIYSTSWSAKFVRDRFPEEFLRVQVVVKQLAAALFGAAAPNQSGARQVGESIGRLSEEVERLGTLGHIREGQLSEARQRIKELRALGERMAAHCAETAAKDAE